MAIDGTAINEMAFFDEETNQRVKINLSVRDIVFFKLLQKLEGALRRG